MLVQYLLTTTKKTKDQMVNLLDNLNTKGNILVGNQLMNNEEQYEINSDNYKATIFNLKSKGVSKNRNFLIKKAVAKFVTFLDDDMKFKDGYQIEVESILNKSDNNCIRFNVESINKLRQIPLLNKKGLVGFRKLTPYGVWGCFYNLEYIIRHNLYFREDIGPGTDIINHGEDGYYNFIFTQNTKIYSYPQIVFYVKQDTSTWQGKNRDLDKEMVSHGFIYYLMYRRFAKLASIIFLLTHTKCYPKKTNYIKQYIKMKEGIKLAKHNKY